MQQQTRWSLMRTVALGVVVLIIITGALALLFVSFGQVASASTSRITSASAAEVMPLPQVPAGRESRIIESVAFGGQISLLSFELANEQLAPGEAIDLTLYWRTRAVLTASYNVSVYVLDAQGNLVAQADSVPGDGAYPTTHWVPGATIQDRHQIALPTDFKAGQYQLAVGVYDAESGQRLKASNNTDSIQLAAIRVK